MRLTLFLLLLCWITDFFYAEVKTAKNIQYINDLAYDPAELAINDNAKPFTGRFVEYYSNGTLKNEGHLLNGNFTENYRNGTKTEVRNLKVMQ